VEILTMLYSKKLQHKVISEVLSGPDTFVVLPTGIPSRTYPKFSELWLNLIRKTHKCHRTIDCISYDRIQNHTGIQHFVEVCTRTTA